MSIWCSGEEIGYDVARKRPKKVRGEVRSYSTGWSNHYPTKGVEKPASVSTAAIAPWCVPGHDQDGKDYACTSCGSHHDGYDHGPWLRLDVDSPLARSWYSKGDDGTPGPDPVHASVILDEEAVRALVADLTQWLDAPKVHPTKQEEQ